VTSAADKLRDAFGRFQAQDLVSAERLCIEVLRESPRYPDAMHLLGVVRLATGSVGEAVSLISGALEGKPQDPVVLEHLGLARVAQGDYAAAERAFRRAIAQGGQHGVLHMRLGMALASQGKFAEGLPALREAAARSPDIPDVHLNLGNTLAARGELDQALASYNRALELQPDNPHIHFNLGNLHRIAGRLEEAVAAYQRVLAVVPHDPDTHNNLGLVYERQQRLDEAAACYRQTLALAPDHVHALSNLGNVLREQGRLDEAAESCDRALAIRADFTDALINLGNVRAQQGRRQEARSLYERVLRLEAGNAEAHRNLGTLFKSQGQHDEAIRSFRRALERNPANASAHLDLGGAYLEGGVLDAAAACFRKALAILPDSAEASCRLAETLKLQGRLDEAVVRYERALALEPRSLSALGGLMHTRQHMCDWAGFEQGWERLRGELAAANDGEVSPFSVLSLPSSAEAQLACATAWARRHVEPIAAARPALGFDFSTRQARDRLRIGYLSWGFHRHATGYWAPELLELHDRSRWEVLAYSYGPDDGSEIRARIRSACDRFIEIERESHLAAARRIYDDAVDVLVDLTGYTLGTRPQIIALRPAPVQVNWFYPGTMGTACMDYFVADPFVVPPGLERHFSERVVRLPDCYMITDRKRPVSAHTPSRAQCGLPDSGIVFCCFNQVYKILPETFDLWMRIMRSVPGSVLWLAEANPWATDNLRRAATARGVAAERLVFAPRKPLPDYLVQYRLADLALDTFPYTSHTTASDALWVGCPLVTCVGDTFASRVAGSVLINAGMRELVTDNPADFERMVRELATSPDRLQDLRRRLRETRDTCALFDTPRFVRNLENAYEDMFKAFLERGPGGTPGMYNPSGRAE
jgi:predicted O-linked N-acetylglucosamine transferase (SPINDLY family)